MQDGISFDEPGLPVVDAIRAGGGDESTVSRLGRFRAGGVMIEPAKTTGASRTVFPPNKRIHEIFKIFYK